jgi:hypothetical protein
MSLPGKKKKVTLSEEAIKAFQHLKVAIATKPVLQLADFNKPFTLKTDASDYAIGGVLLQQDSTGQERPVYFASRTLTKTEQRYSAGEREMLAIYHWIRYWHAYLWGRQFRVLTDHSPLTGIKTRKDISRKLSRMILGLQAYDFELFYNPGKNNIEADVMTREPFVRNTKQKEIPIKDLTQLLCTIKTGDADTIHNIEYLTINNPNSELCSLCLAVNEEKEKCCVLE